MRKPVEPRDKLVSEAMAAAWVRFAKTGNPNGANLPEWPAYKPEAHRYTLKNSARNCIFTRSVTLVSQRIWPVGEHKSAAPLCSPKPGVFRFSLLKNRDVGVGVLPQFEEVLERLFGFRRVAGERGGARQTQVGERIELSPIGVDPGSAP